MLIKNARVMDPCTGFDEVTDIVIESNFISKIGKVESFDGEIIDAKGLVVAPGFVDVHVHFRDPGFTYKEDLKTGAESAAAGGFTSVICMANTNPKMDNEDVIRDFYDRSKDLPIKLYTVAALTKDFKDVELVDMEALSKLGIVGFSDDGIPNKNSKLIIEAMQRAKKLNLPISFHEEDPNFVIDAGVNYGPVAHKLGLIGAMGLAESSFVARDILYAHNTKSRIDIQHISSKESVELVKLGKELGVDVFAEVTPHHFTMTEDDVLKCGTLAKMNPPLRTEEDRQRILKGIREGTIEVIATDHAPHSEEEKDTEFKRAPSGIIGLESSFGLSMNELVDKGHISLMKLLELMSYNPAKYYNLEAGKIEVGKDADLVIFDPKVDYILEKMHSKSKNSPFFGWKLKGEILYTICRGRVVYKKYEA